MMSFMFWTCFSLLSKSRLHITGKGQAELGDCGNHQ